MHFGVCKTITIVTNSKTASVQFYPPMQFDKPLKLNLIYTGLDIAELDSLGLLQPGQIGFCFVPDHGDIEPILNDGILFKVVGGRLGVNNAQINHFSRYCWCK